MSPAAFQRLGILLLLFACVMSTGQPGCHLALVGLAGFALIGIGVAIEMETKDSRR